MKSPRSAFLLILGLAAAGLASAPAAADEPVVAVSGVALAGQPSPAGGRYLLFGDIDVDAVRRVTFTASLTTGSVGIFRTSYGVPQPVVMLGDPAPPDAGNRFFIPLGVASNRRGDLAFICTLFFPDRAGVFLRSGDETVTLALEGTPGPVAGTRFGQFDQIRLLESGEVYLRARLLDESGADVGAAVVAHDGNGLRAVLAPGDRYGFTRRINSVIQYDVNERGEVIALVEVGDFGFLDEEILTEVVGVAAGPPRTLASSNVSFSGGIDLVRHFAVAVDQVHVDLAGGASFYTATNNFPGGGVALNESGRGYENRLVVRQGDPSPLDVGDRLLAFGAFGRTEAGFLAFHALTQLVPQGAILMRPPGGPTLTAARIGGPRPGGGVYEGSFFHMDMNPSGAFVFTELRTLIQTGVFLGRLLGSPAALVEEMISLVASADPGDGAGLRPRLETVARALADGNVEQASRLAASLRQEVASRAGRSIDPALAEGMTALLDDLFFLLGAPPRPTPRQAVDPAEEAFDTAVPQP